MLPFPCSLNALELNVSYICKLAQFYPNFIGHLSINLRHKEALKHARLGAKLAQKLIKKLLPLCSDYMSMVLGQAEEEVIHKLRFPRV